MFLLNVITICGVPSEMYIKHYIDIVNDGDSLRVEIIRKTQLYITCKYVF